MEFYKKVFELLLRLKANFLWPAMWPGYPNPGNSFFADDALNQKMANEWGIVVSTSHHEPMQRAMAEWFTENPEGSWSWIKSREKIQKYFKDGASRARDYESYITLGMRGDGDRAMAVDDPPDVLREILEYQRSVIKDVYGAPDKPNREFIIMDWDFMQFLTSNRRATSIIQRSAGILRKWACCSRRRDSLIC